MQINVNRKSTDASQVAPVIAAKSIFTQSKLSKKSNIIGGHSMSITCGTVICI